LVVCDGQGDQGSHCCTINGVTCPLLFTDRGGTPRCSVWGKWDSSEYLESDAAAWFDERYPGFNCSDWPQRIPALDGKSGPGMCCWSEAGVSIG
jgi:hypothetical protein